MANKTGIEWTDLSSNPIKFRERETQRVGWHCHKLSPGCANCYSEVIDLRWGTRTPYQKKHADKMEPFVNEKELTALLKAKAGQRVFVEDMSDLFLDMIPDAMIDRVMAVINWRRDMAFQVLTKRIERARSYFADPETPWRIFAAQRQHIDDEYCENARFDDEDRCPVSLPMPNLWLGTSVEDQQRANEREPVLRQIPAAVRFLSVEPLLGPIETSLDGIDWLIVGGESGRGARPCDIAWIRSIVRQCKAARVPCFVKQLGARPFDSDAMKAVPGSDEVYTIEDAKTPAALFSLAMCLEAGVVEIDDPKGGDPSEWPEDLRVREWPKSS